MKFNILKASSDCGVHVYGSRFGPNSLISNLKKNIKIKKIINIGFKHYPIKNFEKNNKYKNLKSINYLNKKLYKESYKTLKNNILPITIGGDHSIAIGSALASIKKYNNLGIIWFDAHGDFNTFETTPSGNIHGLPFAAICNYEKKFLADYHNGNFFNPKNAVLVGARDIDSPGELENLKDAGVTIFTTSDIQEQGIDVIYKKAFEIASAGTNGIHISFDIDVIDPSIAPGVSTPAKNGISLTEAFSFVDYMIDNKKQIKSIDFVEFNPVNDVENKTKKIAIEILNRIIKNF